MKKQIRPDAIAIARKFPSITFSPVVHLEGSHLSAPEICLLSRRGLWHMLLFLLVSMVAFRWQDFDLFAAVSEGLWPLLGSPPPLQMIHLVLGIYVFCALMLLPSRQNQASLAQSWAHMGYRTIFYLFYLTANALSTQFVVVFIAGLSLYALEQSYLLLHLAKTLKSARSQM